MSTNNGYYYSRGGLDYRDKLLALVFEYVENGGTSAREILTLIQSTFPDNPELAGE